MPRSRAPTRGRIIDGAYGLFRRKGFARSGMNEIAAASGVTKRTLYQHFESKDALLAAVLDVQHDLAVAAFRSFGDHVSGGPEEFVAAMFADLARWSSQPRWVGSGYTRMVVELADLPGHPAHGLARRHKAVLVDEVASMLERAGCAAPRERARELLILTEGAMMMMLIHRDRAYIDAAACAARRLVRADAEQALGVRPKS